MKTSHRSSARHPRESAQACLPDDLRIEPLLDLAEVEHSTWDTLARDCGNLFATREWISTWWEMFAGHGSLLSFAFRASDGRVVALLPMYVRRGARARELRFLGHGEADRLGPVCAPRDRPAVADAMRRALHESSDRFDVFVGDDVPEHEGWRAALGAHRVRRTSSPLLRTEGMDWEAFLATRSPNFRQQARRRERRLVRGHRLELRLAADASRVSHDLELMLRLHCARWAGSSTSFTGERASFHRAFAPKALARGWLRLWIAELDGRPAAAWYGFRYGGADWYYQAGRDPRYDELSVGFVLMAHTIREALDHGVAEYRLLRGDETYKQRFANDDAPVETVMLEHVAIGAGDAATAA